MHSHAPGRQVTMRRVTGAVLALYLFRRVAVYVVYACCTSMA
jgi:hypothetical protein